MVQTKSDSLKLHFEKLLKIVILEDIIWPLEDAKFLFECGKIFHSFASIYYIDTNKIPNHLTLFFFATKGAINYLAIASLSTGDLFKCEDNMLFSRVKVSCFRAKAHLGGRRCASLPTKVHGLNCYCASFQS